MPSTASIESYLRASPLAERAVCLHSSFKSLGAVDGGPDAVVGGFLRAGFTLMVPSHSWGAFQTSPPAGWTASRNGTESDYAPPRRPSRAASTLATNEVDSDMGAIAKAVVRHEGRVRGDHPLCSFTPLGPLAEELVGAQSSDDVHAPLRNLVTADGAVMLLGVDLEGVTIVHFAEEAVGRQQFIRFACGHGDRPTPARCGGCSAGFGAFGSTLRPIEFSVGLGDSRARAFSAELAVDALIRALQANPEISR